jgi:hypothetical protein
MNVSTRNNAVTHEDIAQRAYEIWQSRGCPPGDGSDDWRAAEAELMSTRVARNGSTQDRMQSWWGRMRQRVSGGKPSSS